MLLDGTQYFGLSLERHVADFIKKQRSAVGKLEFSLLGFAGAREGPFHVPEEFAFDQFFRNGGAVDFDKRRRRALAEEVKIAGDEFFSRATLSVNQNAAVVGRDQGDLFAKRLDRNAVANDVEAFFELMAEHFMGLFELLVRQRRCAQSAACVPARTVFR